MPTKDTFGLEAALLDAIDWTQAVKRVVHDTRSDFIYAPHLNFIYSSAGQEVAKRLASELASGKYRAGLPLTIEVPKSSRMRVKPTQRLGPSFSRPGSILLPKDRLLYQAIADFAAPIIDKATDHSRSFSHQLADAAGDGMFKSTRACWNDLQASLAQHSLSEEHKYIIKLDVANCFASINQHILLQVLAASNLPGSYCRLLEYMLVRFTSSRSSRAIIQGVYPSDLLGNFYLAPIDRYFADNQIASARYVDDIYLFVGSVEAGDHVLRGLIPRLRAYDLSLNEGKSLILPKAALVSEEPDLQVLFEAAVEEISEQIEEEQLDVDYGFQADFSDVDDEEPADFTLKATCLLFDSISEYTGQEENIERFCLPLFAQSGSTYALDHVLDSFRRRPAMAQIYATYLARFVDAEKVLTFLVSLLSDPFLVDWQKMWVLAALSRSEDFDDAVVKVAWDVFSDANRHEALRAVAAVFVGRYGDHGRRQQLRGAYIAAASPYLQAAIYYTARWEKGVERANMIAMWGNLTELNELITIGLQTNKQAAEA